MSRICFPWRREYSRLVGVIYRPVVEVLLHGSKEGWIPVEAYVDSGADISMFPRYIGEDLLGLKVEEGVLIQPMGIGRKTLRSWIHEVTVRLGDEKFEASLAFAETNRVPNLIGRKDLFERFTVVFNQKEHETCFITD